VRNSVELESQGPDQLRAIYANRDRCVPADRYARTNACELAAQHNREFHVMSLLREAGLGSIAKARVLEVGCGRGATLRLLLEYGAQPGNLVGIDLLEDRIDHAKLLNPLIKFLCADAQRVPFADASFDLVIQFTSFSSILSANIRKTVAEEMQRVLAPAGRLLWYDFIFDNPRNADVKGISPREVRLLFPGFKSRGRRITLAPPLGRTVARVSYALYHLLAQFSPLCTHYACVLERE
jgi:ubiquinone/menaquinone biosynthesis C-methylase UbiE